MFAGIVEHVGAVTQLGPAGGAAAHRRLGIDLGPLATGLSIGASVAVSGVCLTLAEIRCSVGGFDVVPETLRLTTLGALRVGDGVNLERSLRVGDRVDGHFVQGHVDGVGTVVRNEQSGGEWRMVVRPPAELARYIIQKGSIAIDGTSLTIADARPEGFAVALIPTTLDRTTLGRRKPGNLVNLETDILARTVVAGLERMLASGEIERAPSSLTLYQLRAAGFVS